IEADPDAEVGVASTQRLPALLRQLDTRIEQLVIAVEQKHAAVDPDLDHHRLRSPAADPRLLGARVPLASTLGCRFGGGLGTGLARELERGLGPDLGIALRRRP